MFVLQFVKAREDASILTNALAALYCLYLQWSALTSVPDPACNDKVASSSNAALQICLGMLVTMFALFMMSGTAPTGDTEDGKEGVVVEEALPPGEKADGEGAAGTAEKRAALIQTHEQGEDSDDDMEKKHFVFPISRETIVFQLAMMLAAMYYSMLCTNWLNPGLYTNGDNTSDLVFWLKTVALWISLAIYLFSMVAPIVFPNRDFN